MRTVAQCNAEIRRLTDRLGDVRKERDKARRRENYQPRLRRWQGRPLAAMKAAVESGVLYRIVAAEFNTSPGCVCNLANLHGWVRKPLPIEQRIRVTLPPGASAPNP